MQVLSTVSKQWANRPNDQRYLSIEDLHNSVQARRQNSRVIDVSLENVTVSADASGEIALLHGQDGQGDKIGSLSHWSFGQLCARARASAGYLRTLPAEIAQIPLAYSMATAGADERDAKIMLRRSSSGVDTAAITSPSYGRIWDDELTTALLRITENNPNWKIPGASYASTDPKRASTLYASDRDVFAFLVDESRPIEVGNEKLFRGFYAWNSETGSEAFGIATFLYRYVCDNRNIWGPQEFKEMRIRHTSGAPHRFAHNASPMLRAYSEASDQPYREMVAKASTLEVGKDRKSVLDWMKARGFTQGTSALAYSNAEKDGLNPRTIWGLVQGVTEHAHTIAHTDARVDLERKAGALFDRVS